MYEEKINMSFEVFRFVKKNLNELREMFPNTKFNLNGKNGEYYVLITSSVGDEFQRASRGTSTMVIKLNNEETRRRMKKKVEKEKKQRRNNDKAARDMMNKMNENKEAIQNGQLNNMNNEEFIESRMRNNMFYGLKLNVPCP